ncbi:MAG: c-type cytochrome [Geobacteraceae bacterium]|jgi:cytochrome c6
MNGKILMGLAILVVCGTFLGGCKKDSAEKPATPEQTPAPAPVSKAEAKKGEELFGQHCTVCHPAGGNIINPEKTLHRKNLEANGIKTVDDIIMTMRNPGPGMNKFDEKTLSNQDAQFIAEYVLNTFK